MLISKPTNKAQVKTALCSEAKKSRNQGPQNPCNSLIDKKAIEPDTIDQIKTAMLLAYGLLLMAGACIAMALFCRMVGLI